MTLNPQVARSNRAGRALPRTIAKTRFGGILKHDLRGPAPLMEAFGFLDAEIAPARFQILGLSMLAFARGNGRK